MNYRKETIEGLTVHHVENDANGNGRIVVHFLNLAPTYEQARKVANSIGGRAYTAKWYGGGFVFYCTPESLVKELHIRPSSILNRS